MDGHIEAEVQLQVGEPQLRRAHVALEACRVACGPTPDYISVNLQGIQEGSPPIQLYVADKEYPMQN